MQAEENRAHVFSLLRDPFRIRALGLPLHKPVFQRWDGRWEPPATSVKSSRHLIKCRKRRGFGRAVSIDDTGAGKQIESLADVAWRQGLTTGQDLTQSPKNFRSGIDDLVEQTASEPHRCDFVSGNDFAQRAEIREIIERDDELRAMQQGSPNLKSGGVETQRRQIQEDF